ncbi:MAG: hypothetical protein KGR26_15390 [Cyanobacteria bacterium REEB65]|nr:hypothetical protein [Cyanobacteria bacterium REEB65]
MTAKSAVHSIKSRLAVHERIENIKALPHNWRMHGGREAVEILLDHARTNNKKAFPGLSHMGKRDHDG